MTAQTSAGTTLGISAGSPVTFNEVGFEALAPFTLIGEITDITGDLGRVYSLVTHNPLASRATEKYKGSYNSGSATISLAIDRSDAGQILAKAALTSDADYSFCITFQDGSKTYFRGKVMSFPTTPGSVDSIKAGTITIEITADDSGNDFVEAAS
jgi:hypothetical protein